MQEYPNVEIMPVVSQRVSPVVSLLSVSEMKAEYENMKRKGLAISKEIVQNYQCLCFALRIEGEIVASSWCNLQRCHDQLSSFPLERDEAYLCNAATLDTFRGMNLAPYLRFQMYKYLRQTGRTKLYSITEFFNTPAIKFKEKLGAQPLKLGLQLKISHKHQFNVTLRTYRTKHYVR